MLAGFQYSRNIGNRSCAMQQLTGGGFQVVFKIGADCLNCGVCLDQCATTAIVERDDQYFIDPEICTECGNCLEVCSVQAIVEE